jgi:hypothetical protein
MVFGKQPICNVCQMKFRNKRSLHVHQMTAGHNAVYESVSSGQSDNMSEQVRNCVSHGNVQLEVPFQAESEVVGRNLEVDEDVDEEESRAECSNSVTGEQDCIVEEIRHTRDMLTLKENPVKGMSGTDYCKKIGAANNMMAVSVPGDGSCQYHAVLKGLQASNYGEALDVEQLRVRVLDELIGNRDRYLSFIAGNDESVERYAAGVVDRQWGDEVTLAAMASALRICIVVYEFTYQRQHIHRIGNEDSEYCVYVTLDKRDDYAAHYGALIPLGNNGERLSNNERNGSARHQRKEHGHHKRSVNLCSKSDHVVGSDGAERILIDASVVSNSDDRASVCDSYVEEMNDSESTCDLSSDVSEMSCSEYSEGSVSSSVSGAGSCRRSSRVKKPNLLHTEEEVFKMPKSPVKGDRCGNCGRFFKNLKRHKKCSGKDSRTVKEHEVATVSDSVESSEVEIDITE